MLEIIQVKSLHIDNIIKKGEVRSTDALKYVLAGAKTAERIY